MHAGGRTSGPNLKGLVQMLETMVPDREPISTFPADVAPLAFALERMPSELFAPALPGEDLADVRTRRAAAVDILDDLLAEYASGLAGGDR
jgi:hypothetical protein